MIGGRRKIVYVTSSDYKKQENRAFVDVAVFEDGVNVDKLFEFVIREVTIQETLEADLEIMVKKEVELAYGEIKIPCIVEHAGLIFEDYVDECYPGGLTKPMWNTLGERFLTETRSADRPAIARAVVAYCNGRAIRTFVGETRGKLAETARGSRNFYWDTVFIPELEEDDPGFGLTYAEITKMPGLGLPYKMNGLSQSSKAMLAFLQDMRDDDPDSLWN